MFIKLPFKYIFLFSRIRQSYLSFQISVRGAARANKKKKTKKKKKKRRGAATAESDEAKADGPAAAAVDEPETKEDASPALERLTLADEPINAEETMAPAPADATESPTIAAPEGAAIVVEALK